MKYKAILWDLDGTLLDTLGDLQEAVNQGMRACGYPERTLDEVRSFVGCGIAELMAKAVPGGREAEGFEKALETFRTYYAEHSAVKTCPYPGVLEVLDTLKAQQVRFAVVTNKFHLAAKELCRQYFGERIDVVIGEQENEGMRRKPEPDMVEAALKKLQVKKEDAVYVGDSEVDVQTAKNARIDGIFVTWGFRTEDVLRREGGEKFVSSAEELLRLLKEG